MPRKRQTHCLLVGDAEHVEFRSAISWLAEQVPITICATPMIAQETAKTLPAVELIVLAQCRPGQFSADEVEALHRLWPLAKLFGLLGNWCEGEGRSGRPWPGVWRIPADNFIAQMSAVLNQSPSRGSRSWQLPRLTSDAERFYCDAAETLRSGSGVVLISATTRDAFEPLADAVRHAGFAAIWQPHQNYLRGKNEIRWEGKAPAEPCTQLAARREPRPPKPRPPKPLPTRNFVASIWDATRGNEDEWRAIRDFAHVVKPAPMLITLGFPRHEDFRLAEELSAELFSRRDKIAVLAKPHRLAEVCGELVHLTGIIVTTDAAGADGQGNRVLTAGAEYDACERSQSKSA